MIKLNYYIKEFPNTRLFKFFRTEDAVEMFKFQNPNYVFIGDE